MLWFSCLHSTMQPWTSNHVAGTFAYGLWDECSCVRFVLLTWKTSCWLFMYLRCCFCLLLFTAVGSITLLLWPLQIRLSTCRSVDSPLDLLVKCRHGSESESESRTDSGSETASASGRGRGCGSMVRIRGLMRTQHFGICTSLLHVDSNSTGCLSSVCHTDI